MHGRKAASSWAKGKFQGAILAWDEMWPSDQKSH